MTLLYAMGGHTVPAWLLGDRVNMTISAQLVWRSPARGTLLECPLWCGASNALYWIDVVDPSIHRHDFSTGASARWELPKPPGSIALMPAAHLLVAMRSSLAILDTTTGTLDNVAWKGPSLGEDRFNDGVTDRQGNFWIGTMDRRLAEPIGRLFRIDAAFNATATPIDARLSNGLCFSPAGDRLYLSKTIEREIHAFDVDSATGALSGARRIVAYDAAPGRPDGSTVAADGSLWSARIDASRIDRYGPDGEVLDRLPLPISHPTHCTFGGPGMQTLYVTTSRFGAEFVAGEHGDAGYVLGFRLDQRGLPGAIFATTGARRRAG